MSNTSTSSQKRTFMLLGFRSLPILQVRTSWLYEKPGYSRLRYVMVTRTQVAFALMFKLFEWTMHAIMTTFALACLPFHEVTIWVRNGCTPRVPEWLFAKTVRMVIVSNSEIQVLASETVIYNLNWEKTTRLRIHERTMTTWSNLSPRCHVLILTSGADGDRTFHGIPYRYILDITL